uniref:Neuroligin-4, Y-linked-like n=1 Tax=Hirondellea gigas TaxID=1518452 RepID=A0A6A7GA10_9CRUS
MFQDVCAGFCVTIAGPNVGRGSIVRRRKQWHFSCCHDMLQLLLVALVALVAVTVVVTPASGEASSPRVVETRQGKLRGIIRPLANKNLRPVEVFLGVPYATPPTGTNRFSPTRAPSPWDGEREARQYGPVCPQLLPDLTSPRPPKNRLLLARKLANHLTNQAEDCLYLNVYVPSQVVDTVAHKAFPVMVYIHGDSFEWGAANPYDGSVMAAYGEVIIVTLNYRLGPLGFLNTNADTSSRGHVMNHGLMDQIAALHWVQENIGAFGGDPGSVTLMGHGTGAACVHFLMASAAVVPGLFHRAILLSGSALSSWASVGSPTHYAMQYAKALNCSQVLPTDPLTSPSNEQFDHMVNCLKDRSLEQLQSVKLDAPRFLYSFGPSIDSIVIKSDFRRPIHSLGDEPRKEYDILFGVVPNEAYDDFSESDLLRGFDIRKRDRILRTLVRNTFDYHLNEVFISAVNEYTDWEQPEPSPKSVRDATMEALSDARYVSPLLQSIVALTSPHRQHYFYVFDYVPDSVDMPVGIKGTIHGEELAYLFGAPLVGELGIFSSNWTQQDVLVSETMLIYFTNFVKTGDPNLLTGQELRVNDHHTSVIRGIKWGPYDTEFQRYMCIGSRVASKNHYRAHSLALWIWLVPQLQTVGRLEFLTLRAPGITQHQQEQPFDPEERLQELSVLHHLFPTHDDPALYLGGVRPLRHMAGHYIIPSSTTTESPATTMMEQPPPPPIQQLSSDVHSNVTALAEATMPQDAVDYIAYSTALSVTVAIGVSLLILNILIFAGVYYQRDRTRLADKHDQQTRLSSASSSEHQMAAISSGTAGSTIGSTSALDVIAKTPQTTIAPCRTLSSTPFTQTQTFAHISECPPAFADTLVTFTSQQQSVLPHITPPSIPNGDVTGNTMPRPPPPPRLSSESQPLLPANIPGPPRGKIPTCEELRV